MSINHADIFEWQSATDLAEKIGADSGQVSYAGKNRSECHGWQIRRRKAGEADWAGPYDRRTKYLYRATTRDDAPSPLVDAMAKKEVELRKAEARISELEAALEASKAESKAVAELVGAVNEMVVYGGEDELKLLRQAFIDFCKNGSF